MNVRRECAAVLLKEGGVTPEILAWGVLLIIIKNEDETLLETYGKEGGGHRSFIFGDFFGGAPGDNLAAVGAGFGAEVKDVVSFGSQVHVVLDDDDGVAFVDESMQDIGEFCDVLLVKADGRLFNEVEIGVGGSDIRNFGPSFGERGDQLETLGFATAEGGTGLTECEVVETGISEELERLLELGMGRKEGRGGLNIQTQNFANIESVVTDLECGVVVSFTKAGFAVDPGGGEEIHFEFNASVAFAFRALALLVIKGKAGGGVATHAGVRELGKEGADVVEEFDVGGRAGAGGFSDGGLINFVAVFEGVEAGGGGEWRVLGFLLASNREAATHEG
jgi:hypothetical protein